MDDETTTPEAAPLPQTNGRERELKLDVAPGAASSLAGRLNRLAGARRRGPAERLVSLYFDTPEHALGAAGASLRIRSAGRRRTLTLKGQATGAGLIDRLEIERQVRSDRLALAAAERDALGAMLGEPPDEASLVPTFSVAVERAAWDFERGDTAIEIALDRGEVTAGGAAAAFWELELELRAGDPRTLFAVARELSADVPLRLGASSKAGRGYEMLRGPERRSFKAQPSPVAPGQNVEEAFLSILGSCVTQYRLNETLLLARWEPKAIHQARVALRRLRSAFSLFRDAIAGPEGHALKAELKWLAGSLGDARDADVLAARLREPAAPLADRIEERRSAAYAAAREAIESRRARTLMLDLAEWAAIGPWRNDPASAELRGLPVERFAADALDRRFRKLRKRGRRLAEISPEERHEARIAAKKLRYAGEFFEPLYEGKSAKRFAAFGAALKGLQNELGQLNDIAAGRATMRALADDPETAFAAGEVAGRDAARAPDLLAAAKERFKALKRAEPYWR